MVSDRHYCLRFGTPKRCHPLRGADCSAFDRFLYIALLFLYLVSVAILSPLPAVPRPCSLFVWVAFVGCLHISLPTHNPRADYSRYSRHLGETSQSLRFQSLLSPSRYVLLPNIARRCAPTPILQPLAARVGNPGKADPLSLGQQLDGLLRLPW